MPDLNRKEQPLGQRPALLLVDLCLGFTDPASPLGSECESAIAANQLLLAEFRRRRLPVIFTTVMYDSPAQARVFRNRLPDLNILLPGSPWVEIDPRVAPANNETVVVKQYASGFFGTDLAQKLRTAGADSLVVTGMTTSGCVRATAVDGLQHDYPVAVVSDAVSDRNEQAHQANLHDLEMKYAEVLDTSQIIKVLASLEVSS